MPFTFVDFCYSVAIVVAGGSILKIISFIYNKTDEWVKSINTLSREVKEDRERIENLERKFKKRLG